MFFRCTTCLAATWIGTDRPPVADDNVTCDECGRSYIARPTPELGSTEGSHYRHTTSFAAGERLDMATAYSFLLGLIGREEMSAVEGLEVEESALDEEELLLIDNLEMEEPAPQVKRPDRPFESPPAIDPGFQKAVARGRLTMEEALRRGDRSAYADNLSRRYDLTMDLALAVADNRITLFQARKNQEARPTPEKRVATPPAEGNGKRLAVVALVAVAIVGLTWGFSQKEVAPRSRSSSTQANQAPATTATTPAATAYSSTEILTDSSGRMTKVVGLDARTVLHAYCGSGSDSTFCDPLEIMDTVPPSREVRLGTFHDPDWPDEVRAVSIQRDRFTRRWVAGDGKSPIRLTDLPEVQGDDQVNE